MQARMIVPASHNPYPPTLMENSSASPEQMASASSGITFAITAIAAAGCALGTGTIMAMKFGTHPPGEQLTGFQVGASLIIPLIAAFIPIALVLLGRRKTQDHSCGHCSH